MASIYTSFYSFVLLFDRLIICLLDCVCVYICSVRLVHFIQKKHESTYYLMISTLSSLIIDQFMFSVSHFEFGNWLHFFLHLSHRMLRPYLVNESLSLNLLSFLIAFSITYPPYVVLTASQGTVPLWPCTVHCRPLDPPLGRRHANAKRRRAWSTPLDMKSFLPCPAVPCPALLWSIEIYWDLLEYVCCAILSLYQCFSKVMLRVLSLY